MKKIVLIFGIIGGLTVTVLMFTTMPLWQENMDFKTGEIVGYISMVVSLSTIFFGIKSFRDNQMDGSISFGKGFQVGILITLTASVIYVVGWMVYSHVIDPEFMDRYYTFSIQELQESGKPAAEIEAQIKGMESFKEMYKSPLVQIGITFLEIFPLGLLITLISSLVLMKKKVKVKHG